MARGREQETPLGVVLAKFHAVYLYILTMADCKLPVRTEHELGEDVHS